MSSYRCWRKDPQIPHAAGGSPAEATWNWQSRRSLIFSYKIGNFDFWTAVLWILLSLGFNLQEDLISEPHFLPRHWFRTQIGRMFWFRLLLFVLFLIWPLSPQHWRESNSVSLLEVPFTWGQGVRTVWSYLTLCWAQCFWHVCAALKVSLSSVRVSTFLESSILSLDTVSDFSSSCYRID